MRRMGNMPLLLHIIQALYSQLIFLDQFRPLVDLRSHWDRLRLYLVRGLL
jgi:hypothetical protein